MSCKFYRWLPIIVRRKFTSNAFKHHAEGEFVLESGLHEAWSQCSLATKATPRKSFSKTHSYQHNCATVYFASKSCEAVFHKRSHLTVSNNLLGIRFPELHRKWHYRWLQAASIVVGKGYYSFQLLLIATVLLDRAISYPGYTGIRYGLMTVMSRVCIQLCR